MIGTQQQFKAAARIHETRQPEECPHESDDAEIRDMTTQSGQPVCIMTGDDWELTLREIRDDVLEIEYTGDIGMFDIAINFPFCEARDRFVGLGQFEIETLIEAIAYRGRSALTF